MRSGQRMAFVILGAGVCLTLPVPLSSFSPSDATKTCSEPTRPAPLAQPMMYCGELLIMQFAAPHNIRGWPP